jgi:N4-gp56 family major capsid protein
MSTTTYNGTGVTPRTNVYAEREMLKHAQPVMVLDKLAVAKQMPKNKTETISFRRPRTFDAVTTPLQEGVTPAVTAFRYDDVSVALRQYGMVVEWTDVIEDLHEDPVGRDAALQAGENIGRTMEALNWAVVRAGTSVFYANGSQRTDVNTPISLAKQRAVIRSLQAQKAKPITKILDAGLKYATRAVEAAWVAVAHTDLEADIRNLPGFLPVAQYASRKPISDYEIGSVENVRYILSPDLAPFVGAGGAPGTTVVDSTSASAADVYPVVFFGQDSWGTVALRGQGAVSPSIIPAGQKTKDDPLGQRGYVGWKTYHAALILNQSWMARLEVAATRL